MLATIFTNNSLKTKTIKFALLQVMKAHGCYNLVFSSSCTVYGSPEFLPITEEHPTGKVTNVYGRTKYFVEEMLKDVSVAEKVNQIFRKLGAAS